MNLGPSVPAGNYDSDETGPFTDISPEVGILGTPVIDPSTSTLYVVAATFENGNYYHRLHALDTGTGAEKFAAPIVIQASIKGTGDGSAGGSVAFDSSQHLQRPALLLLNGIVYICFGSHGDTDPYHGWVIGYSASDVRVQTAVMNVTPDGGGGAIWQAGRGPAADGQGNIYVVSSNGDTDEASNYSDNVLKLTTPDLAVDSYFAPSNVQELNDDDDDLGAAGAILVPGTNMLLTGGKQGILYSLNSSAIAKSNETFDVAGSFGIFNMALWNRSDGPLLFLHPANSPFQVYRISSGRITKTPLSQSSATFGVPFEGMTLSANGTQAGSGILWATTADSYPLPSTGTLHAWNADDLSQELWSGPMGPFVKFANPTVVNGKVYLPGASSLMVYGLPSGVPGTTPVITGIVNAASYAAAGLAPGEITTIYGANFGEGATVNFNGMAAPMIFSTPTAVAAVVPFEVAGLARVTTQVTYNGLQSTPEPLPVAASAPGIFSLNASGSGPGAILNQDYSVNSATNPAAVGSVVMIYATGGGLTAPKGVTGALAPGAEPLASKVTVSMDGVDAPVWYAGSAPDEIEGAVSDQRAGAGGLAGAGTVPVTVTVNGQASQSTVTLVVH